jgi:hypothetical protein
VRRSPLVDDGSVLLVLDDENALFVNIVRSGRGEGEGGRR